MASRKVEDLVPELQEKFKLFATRMAETGIPFALTCTYRTQEEQYALYAQGRTKPGPKVTWTLKSKHIDRKAFDIVILKDGRASWDVKVDVNHDQIPDYDEAGKIGELCGLKWGGRFKSPDRPHFEI